MANLIASLIKIPLSADAVKKLPEGAGVYMFLKAAHPIYIGKAINLKRRVGSYFDFKLETKTAKMIREAKDLAYIKVGSELESLLLEAKLIRKYMPHYNIAAKDDKHPLYIKITKEAYPRIVTARKPAQNETNLAFFGPFPDSTSVRSVLKMLRKIFPYSDHKISNRGCIYSHIGLCEPCPSIIEMSEAFKKAGLRKKYLQNISLIKAVLSGKIANVKVELEKEMKVLADKEKYEDASGVLEKIRRLEYITQPQMPVEFYVKNPNLYEDIKRKEQKELCRILRRFDVVTKKIERIECFDVAHLAGVNPTASMVTFVQGDPDKKYYRHFKIHQSKTQSDTDSMKEVIKRRIKHLADWGRPDLLIVDGGKPQVSMAMRELIGHGIPVVGLAKKFETLVIPKLQGKLITFKEYKLQRGPALFLLARLRDEAHRFARRYHHRLISISIVNERFI
jgi:excinuclease ABC subunit C